MKIMHSTPNDAQEATTLLREAMGDIAQILTGEYDEQKILSTLKHYFLAPKNRLSHHGIWLYHDTQAINTYKESSILGAINLYLGGDVKILDEPIRRHLLSKGIEYEIEAECENGELYIDSLAVKPAYRNRGIGKALITHAITTARNMNTQRVSLLVDCDKIATKEYYARIGFRDDGSRSIGNHRYNRMIFTL